MGYHFRFGTLVLWGIGYTFFVDFSSLGIKCGLDHNSLDVDSLPTPPLVRQAQLWMYSMMRCNVIWIWITIATTTTHLWVHTIPAIYAHMSFTIMRDTGSRNQIIPSKMLETKNDDGTNTTNRIMCVQAYWPNWYKYMPFFKLSTKKISPASEWNKQTHR